MSFDINENEGNPLDETIELTNENSEMTEEQLLEIQKMMKEFNKKGKRPEINSKDKKKRRKKNRDVKRSRKNNRKK